MEYVGIEKLSLEELSEAVEQYPWFVAARSELYRRLVAMGGLDERQLSMAAMHIGDRKVLTALLRGKKPVFEKDIDVRKAQVVRTEVSETRPRVAGGDFFSREEYERVRKNDDAFFSRKNMPMTEIPKEESTRDEQFCTETLAQIYIEQGYFDLAEKIYSKLILEYPEKSVYFAALIDKLKENINS